MPTIRLLFIATVTLCCSLGTAQESTLAATVAPITIEDAAWLAGRWIGEGLGGDMEESWSPPVGGQMVGHFRLVQQGTATFYEFMLLDVSDGGLRMRLKHFNPDYSAWETVDEWTTFTPVSASEQELVFSALRIQRDGEDAMTMRLNLRNGETVTEEILRFRRAPL